MKKLLVLALILSAGAQPAYAIIEAYPGSTSVRVGETLNFHISANVGTVSIDVGRLQEGYNKIVIETGLPVTRHPVTAEEPWATGADWPVTYSFTIPDDWEPGLYDFRVRKGTNDALYKRFQVAVQPANFGDYSKVAVLTNEPTYNAYGGWGGKSNYSGASVMSFNRPGIHAYFFTDWAFPLWASKIGMPVEHVTALQLHYDPSLLDAYDVLVLTGHSEYWSREMRAGLEQFLERGGKLVSLSGNTMWWAVRFKETPTGTQMISCKGQHSHPECPANDPDLFTGYWWDHEGTGKESVGNPESLVFGASFRFGGYVDSHGFYTAEQGYGGYFAEKDGHWFWAGTGILKGDHVGQAAGIAGYEGDSPPLILNRRKNLIVDPTAENLPSGIELLGTSPAATSSWEGHAAIIYFPYGDNGGEVFNCGSVDCALGLYELDEPDHTWRKALLNVFSRFGVLQATLTDVDSDTINDADDNCVDVPNPDQLDEYSDGTGDVCDQHCH